MSCILAKAIRERYGEAAWESLLQKDGQEYAIDILFYPTINERFGGVNLKYLIAVDQSVTYFLLADAGVVFSM